MGEDVDIRVDDVERAGARTMLDEHLSAGRLTIAEHEERHSLAGAARTRGDDRRLRAFSGSSARQCSRGRRILGVEIEPSDLRISDTEREDAIRKLGEHLGVGRLGVDEYGERTAQVATAKTRGELLALFKDLPDPRPYFGQTLAASRTRPAAARRTGGPPQRWEDRPLAQRLWGAAVPLSAILAVILFLTVFKVWFIFLLPAAIAVIGGAIWGEDWRHDRHRWDHRRQEWGRGD